jgi:NodT family efflux transporter outer membrane factor (OMF) lipoprotein
MRAIQFGRCCFPGALCLFLLLGCANHVGLTTTTARLLEAEQLKDAEIAQKISDWPRSNWWQAYANPTLDELVEQALSDNPDSQAAEARIRRAAALVQSADSDLWPRFGVSAELNRMRLSERGQFPPPLTGTTQNINDGKLGATWELDFFGKNRASLQAALGIARAAEAERQAARLLLASQVVQGYFELARLLEQRTLLQRNQVLREVESQLIKRRYLAGLDTRSEAETAQGRISEAARDLATLEGQIELARHALSNLTGQGPKARHVLTPRLPPALATTLPTRLPARLVGHRADIVAARWRVEAALQDLEAAHALFYPDINLRAFVGYSSIGSLDHWLEAGSRQPGLGLALNLPIFDAGRLRAHYQAQTAETDTAILAYNTALLHGLREVADLQALLQALDTQLERQQLALSSTETTLALARQRYQSGLSGRLPVLHAEGDAISQRRLLTDLQARQLSLRVQLTQALGGGYEAPLPPAY